MAIMAIMQGVSMSVCHSYIYPKVTARRFSWICLGFFPSAVKHFPSNVCLDNQIWYVDADSL